MDYSKIKLIIWDLDETFWKGILSEGPIVPIQKNITLLSTLTDHGIVNSICSKNDYEQTVSKLKELQVNDLFVFKSIDWAPKGQRINKLIKDMGLRPVNCLFIDDNVVNLNEALFYSPDLMIAEPTIIPNLISYFNNQPASDLKHKRLKNYKVLEQKQQAKAASTDNLAFLFSTKTQVDIYYDCINEIDRITELVNRTNQLNFTKLRSTKEELISLLSETDVNSGYVKVKDAFGDYGIVGFYALKNNNLIHFLFSCRTIGQGVEQYVYAKLGYPNLNTVGEVVNSVTKEEAPKWINQEIKDTHSSNTKMSDSKVLFKGGCDLMNMSAYLNTKNVIEEFTYIGKKRNNNIEHHNHSTNILSFPFLNKKERINYVNNYTFADEDMFDTHIFDQDISIIFIGTMIEPNLGIYQNKSTGKKIAFGEFSHPLTDPNEWDSYINNTIFTADNHFTKEWLQKFSNNHIFLGALTPHEIIENYKSIITKIGPNTKICFLLGSEIPFKKEENKNYFGRENIYKEINNLIKKLAETNKQVLYIDFNDYIKGQEDFTNNINHFQRRVYYEAAIKANVFISELTGEKLEQKSRVYLKIKEWIDDIGKTGFYQTGIWKIVRIPYIWLKKKL